MPLLFNDHDKFHAAVARCLLACGAATVLGLFLSPLFAVAALALAVGLSVVPPRSWRSFAVALVCACFAGGATALGPVWGAVLAALSVGASVGRELPGWERKLAAGALGALGMAGATLVSKAVAVSGAFAFLPTGLEALAGGAAGGLVLGVSSAGRHLERATPLGGAKEAAQLTAAADGDDGEIGQLLLRGRTAYEEARAALGQEAPEALLALDDLVGRMARFGQRWREVEREAARTQPEVLQERIARLEDRVLASSDAQARGEFQRARDAMAAQLAALAEIAQGRERAVARLTHQVAILERLRLSAVRHRSVDAGRLGAELAPVVEELSAASGEMDLAADALNEATTAALT